ncbi:type IV toxin-antitoxin system AbiEi family antitoxin [Curtobacterium oceanosedimentum]|uniref:type IV toxin-antitoxin system AbiEi family antitoxin n=1 Tax=Curtobacterium oceanosedimentum TaxID=465820 RepID=UPI001CE04FDC|nr:type IV toxin-antitoxin system AbiEi family antitoxin [Curtobacterium oceanosedimentum]MCA5922893.1 hypothetical protein [Curtobacterium oceanosedimentum]
MPRSRLLTGDDWPEAELRAAVLAGELVAVGPCWASPSEPQTVALRAAAVAWALRDPRLIACTVTAAWVWGAVSRPPEPLEVCTPAGLRVRVRAEVRLREVRIEDVDVVRVADLRVSSPGRTVVDLLRTPATVAGGFGGVEATAVHGLLATGAASLTEVLDRLAALGTVPMARQAERRLRAVQAGAAPGVSPR